jgi:hypothetical protein
VPPGSSAILVWKLSICTNEMVPLQIDLAIGVSDGTCSVACLTQGVPDTRRLVARPHAALGERYGAPGRGHRSAAVAAARRTRYCPRIVGYQWDPLPAPIRWSSRPAAACSRTRNSVGHRGSDREVREDRRLEDVLGARSPLVRRREIRSSRFRSPRCAVVGWCATRTRTTANCRRTRRRVINTGTAVTRRQREPI